jgi:hypothetical protein
MLRLTILSTAMFLFGWYLAKPVTNLQHESYAVVLPPVVDQTVSFPHGKVDLPHMEFLKHLLKLGLQGEVSSLDQALSNCWSGARPELRIVFLNEFGSSTSVPTAGVSDQDILTMARISPLAALAETNKHSKMLKNELQNYIYMIWGEQDPFAALQHFKANSVDFHTQSDFSNANTENYLASLGCVRDPVKFKELGLKVDAARLAILPPDQAETLGSEVGRMLKGLASEPSVAELALIKQFDEASAKALSVTTNVENISETSAKFGISKSRLRTIRFTIGFTLVGRRCG